MNNQRNPLQIPSGLYSDHVITLAIVAIMICWVSLFFCLTQLTTRTAPLLGISIMSLSILMHSNGDMLNRCKRRLIHCLTTFLLKSLTKKFTFFSIRGGKFGNCHIYVASWPVERWPHASFEIGSTVKWKRKYCPECCSYLDAASILKAQETL